MTGFDFHPAVAFEQLQSFADRAAADRQQAGEFVFRQSISGAIAALDDKFFQPFVDLYAQRYGINRLGNVHCGGLHIVRHLELHNPR